MNEFQKRVLTIYEAISRLCEKENIRHYAIGGTCLGAVRHKGFIPWDDDLDIAMPIEDYRRFIEIANDLLPAHLKLLLYSDSQNLMFPFAKVIDTRTTAIEETFLTLPHGEDAYTGVWVDIMPMSGEPSSWWGRQLFALRIKSYYILNRNRKATLATKKSLKGKLQLAMLSPLKLFFRRNYFLDAWNAMLYNHPFDGSEYTGYTWSQHVARLTYPSEWFKEYELLDFEGGKIRCPKGWDEYLTVMFGNYMELPPESERVSGHHFAVVDLEHSYKDYQVGKYTISS